MAEDFATDLADNEIGSGDVVCHCEVVPDFGGDASELVEHEDDTAALLDSRPWRSPRPPWAEKSACCDEKGEAGQANRGGTDEATQAKISEEVALKLLARVIMEASGPSRPWIGLGIDAPGPPG